MKTQLTTLVTTATLAASTFACGPYEITKPISVAVAPDQGAVVTGSTTEVVLKIQVNGHEIASKKNRLPLNIAVVLDRSGSMSGTKLEQAKQAASHLVRQLGAADRFSLVTYDTEVNILIPPAPVLEPAPLLTRISGIQTGGSTALYAGVAEGAAQLKTFLSAERVNRVILLSDGIANVGPSSPAEISALGRSLASSGIPVTTVGLGADYQEDVLSSLAEASDANYYYVADIEKLPEVFGKEFDELQSIVARDVKIQINCGEGVTPIGFAGRDAGTSTVTFGSLSANQQRDIYFRCKVAANQSIDLQDIATISTTYTGIDGVAANASTPARLEIVATSKEAESRQNAGVRADYEILTSNFGKREAIAAADAGQHKEAKSQLSSLRRKLVALLPSAPAGQQIAIQEEVTALDESLSDFDKNSGRLSKTNRKALQSQEWKLRNAK
ncbi:VWA domain-containing protein [Verrucomicrobiales bacterium]|nr:VWA domain-containing protein [Verrucomicrobiales bacterium]